MRKRNLCRSILVLLFVLILSTAVFAQARGMVHVHLDVDSHGVGSPNCYGYYKEFKGSNSSLSSQNVWYVAQYQDKNGAYQQDLATDVSLAPGYSFDWKPTVYTETETYWNLWLQPWDGGTGCIADGYMRICN